MSQSEYARARGVSRQLVSRWKKQGRLVVTDDGQVDVQASDRVLRDVLDPTRGGDRTGKRAAAIDQAAADAGAVVTEDGQVMSLEEARRRELASRAIKQELETAQLQGELVTKESVMRAAQDQGLKHMEQLRSVPDRIAHQLHSAPTAEDARRLLAEELERIAAEFREGLKL
jgi:phage terminase Nu1 subunit (DNA packaging protein)